MQLAVWQNDHWHKSTHISEYNKPVQNANTYEINSGLGIVTVLRMGEFLNTMEYVCM